MSKKNYFNTCPNCGATLDAEQVFEHGKPESIIEAINDYIMKIAWVFEQKHNVRPKYVKLSEDLFTWIVDNSNDIISPIKCSVTAGLLK